MGYFRKKRLYKSYKQKSAVFVKHIEEHLKTIGDGKWVVTCKICGKNIDEIYDEYKKEHDNEIEEFKKNNI